MSILVMSQVWACSRSTLADRLVLLAIADNAHDDGGGAWPSIDTIASKARVSRRTVIRALESLQALGELVVEPNAGPRGVNTYRVLLSNLKAQPVVGREMSGGDKMAPRPKAGGDICVPICHPNHQEPPDQTKDNKNRSLRLVDGSALPTGRSVPPSVLEWLKLRGITGDLAALVDCAPGMSVEELDAVLARAAADRSIADPVLVTCYRVLDGRGIQIPRTGRAAHLTDEEAAAIRNIKRMRRSHVQARVNKAQQGREASR